VTRYSYPSTGPIRSCIWRPMPPMDFSWGFGWSLAFATGYSIFVLLLSVLRRATYWPTYNLSTWQIIGIYYAAAIINGLVLSVSRPLLKWRLGAFFVGMLVAGVVYGLFGLKMIGWHEAVVWMALVLSVLVGGGLGIVFYDKHGPPL
jgi:hypothetical protein